MKDLMRQKVAVQDSILKQLNAQIKLEGQSSAVYLAMAAWCDQNSFDRTRSVFLGYMSLSPCDRYRGLMVLIVWQEDR